MAEGEGFEPSKGLPPWQFSRLLPSTARSPFRERTKISQRLIVYFSIRSDGGLHRSINFRLLLIAGRMSFSRSNSNEKYVVRAWTQLVPESERSVCVVVVIVISAGSELSDEWAQGSASRAPSRRSGGIPLGLRRRTRLDGNNHVVNTAVFISSNGTKTIFFMS